MPSEPVIHQPFQSSQYILTRAEKLQEAAQLMETENQEIAAQLRWRDRGN